MDMKTVAPGRQVHGAIGCPSVAMSAQVPLAHTGQLHMTSFTSATHSNSHSELWSRAGFARHGQEGCGDAGERPWGKRKEGFV